MGKNFQGPFPFSKIKTFWKKNKKVKVKLKTTSGKKFCTIKFTAEEFDTIVAAAEYQKQTVQQFFKTIIEDLVKDEQRNTHLRELQD